MDLLAVIRASRPVFRDRYDRIAYALHAFVEKEGYIAVAAGTSAETISPADAFAVTSEADIRPTWNELPDAYAFLYRRCNAATGAVDPASPPLIVRALRADPQLVVQAALLGPGGSIDRTCDFELSPGAYATDTEYSDPEALAAQLKAGLGPVLHGPAAAGAAATGAAAASSRPGPGPAQPVPGPSRPDPLRADDDYEDDPLRDPRFGGRGGPRGPPLGARDVVPPGMRPPGMVPEPGMPEGYDPFSGGMHMGPRDPMFLGGGGRGPGGGFPGGGGARYDPINPPGLPGWNPGDFIPPGQGRGRGRGGPGQGPQFHPDVMQPGRRDDWGGDDMFM